MDHQLEEPYSVLFLMLLTVEPNKAMTPLMKCEVPISKARLFGRALINAPIKPTKIHLNATITRILSWTSVLVI